jgi:hypothetical protein
LPFASCWFIVVDVLGWVAVEGWFLAEGGARAGSGSGGDDVDYLRLFLFLLEWFYRGVVLVGLGIDGGWEGWLCWGWEGT